jgi:two-component system sensor histidine kinase TctE
VPAPVRAHPWGLRELTRNLLHNALKHSPPGGALQLRVAVDGDTARLTVSDDGPGIADALRPRLTQAFAGGGGPGSAGLGLAICREIVQQLGGSLALDNRPAAADRRAGLDAVVRLPLAATGDNSAA